MGDNKVYVYEKILHMAFKDALESSVYKPLIFSDCVIENIDSISISFLRTIQNEIIIAIAEGKIAEIDMLTWDKLHYEICRKLG